MSSPKMIPVYEPILGGNEKKYLGECVSGGWVSSEGAFVRQFEEAFAKWAGTRYAVAVCNGTAALETALWSANVRSGMVALPSSTIISCLLAVLRVGAKPFLFDLNLSDCSMCFNVPQAFFNAIMPVHLFGHFQDMDKIREMLSPHNGRIVEDRSQYWDSAKVDDVACYSLYANKTITSGEGGIIVTNDRGVYENARNYRNLCHSSQRFVHDNLGYNFRMSNLQAAVALAQLEQIDKFIEIKRKNLALYKKYLPDGVTLKCDVKIPWMYLVETRTPAGYVVDAMAIRKIICRRFFFPLSYQPCVRGYLGSSFPNGMYAWRNWFYLPSGLTLTEKQIKYICKTLGEVLDV